MREKKRGEERTGYRGQKTALQTSHWSMGSVLIRRVGTKPGCALKCFVLAVANSGSSALYDLQRWFSFYFVSKFLSQTFSSNFLWWTFEIHKKVESKMNILFLDSTIFNVLPHLLYLYMYVQTYLFV